MKKVFFSLFFIFLFIFINAQIDLVQANKLAEFVGQNADTSFMEGDSKSYKLFLPEQNFSLRVSQLGNQKVLEIFDMEKFDSWSVFLNAKSFDGNILQNLFSFKYLPENRQKKEQELNFLIQKLSISKINLVKQRAELNNLTKKFQKFLDKPRSFEEYLKIKENPIWEGNLIILTQEDDYKKIDFFCSDLSLEKLRKISKIYFP